uniref:ATP synthase complex subunit 8 n=1 Tax=Leptogaster longicauda TaxID=1812705 RepID=A0A164R1D6_9MUSC|nr:ATP synthase F0 subunit 8 [Leptogaster longicauda]
MPQMAPISWLNLFMMFSLTMILFSMMNYYIYMIKQPKNFKKNFKINYLTWKW